MRGRPVVFGEVLYDRFPDGSMVLGGAPFNVAWHLQAFGLEPLFISRVGNDPLGRHIRDAMTGWGMDTAGLQMDSSRPTGTVEVTLRGHEPSYEIVEQRAYDFIAHDALPDLSRTSLIYHGTLALRNPVSREALQHISQQLDAPCFLDVNLRDPWWSMELALQLLHGADLIKLNSDELLRLTAAAKGDMDVPARFMHEWGARLLVLTLGEEGACAYTSEGVRVTVAPERATEVVDTVGAGDAFSSVMILGHLSGWPIEDTLRRAQQFASAIVAVRGATVSDPAFYQQITQHWKKDQI